MPELKTPYTIILEYANLKITIEAKTYESTLEAYLIGNSVIEEAQKLGFIKPKLTTTELIVKNKR